jgi:hypothetical protein
MKTTILLLAMLLTAATAFNQTSRKPANKNTATNTKENVTTNRSKNPSENRQVSFAANRQGTERPTDVKTRTDQPNRNRETTRDNNTNQNNTNQSRERTNNNTNQSRERTYNRENQHNTNTNANTVSRRPNTNNSATRPHVVEYESPRVYRETHHANHYYHNPPQSREYRSIHYVYRRPLNLEVYWTPVMYNHFMRIYPMVNYWNYYNGYRIEMISAYDALYYRGNVMTVYGQVTDVFYSRATDEYFLYFGAYYPYQDFTVILPGYLARSYSRHPEYYFDNQYMAVTGLITTFNGEPEIVVKESFQMNLY